MPSRRLRPDRATEIALTGCARRHALDDTRDAEAIAEPKLIANGRADLLAEAAGHALGGYLGAPGMCDPREVKAAALLVMAGADPTLVPRHTDVTRALVGRGGHSTPGRN